MSSEITRDEIDRAVEELGPTARWFDLLSWLLKNIPARDRGNLESDVKRLIWLGSAEEGIVAALRDKYG